MAALQAARAAYLELSFGGGQLGYLGPLGWLPAGLDERPGVVLGGFLLRLPKGDGEVLQFLHLGVAHALDPDDHQGDLRGGQLLDLEAAVEDRDAVEYVSQDGLKRNGFQGGHDATAAGRARHRARR